MAKKPETVFKERFQLKLDKIPNSWWLKTQLISTVGIPDIIGCVGGTFVALELKRDMKEANRRHSLQRHILKVIKDAGGFASFTYPENSEEILAKIRCLHSSS